MPFSFRERRAWFDRYAERADAGELPVSVRGLKFPCACCGYPTLDGIPYEVCVLCGWEHNGQDDPHADEVWEGANHGYSLAEARRNFEHHLSMFSSERDRLAAGVDRAHEQGLKQSLIAVFDRMPFAPAEALEGLWEEVDRLTRLLDAEVDRVIRAAERKAKRS